MSPPHKSRMWRSHLAFRRGGIGGGCCVCPSNSSAHLAGAAECRLRVPPRVASCFSLVRRLSIYALPDLRGSRRAFAPPAVATVGLAPAHPGERAWGGFSGIGSREKEKLR